MLLRTFGALLAPGRGSTFPALRRENLPPAWGRLELVRDGNGVAHLYAEEERDLFAAVGYLQGAERFVVLDLLRHLGAGRMTELVGNLKGPMAGLHGRRVSELDAFLIPLGFEPQSRRDLARLSARGRATLESFSAGVNAALRAARGVYSPEYLVLSGPRWWEPADCLLAARACAFIVSLTAFENELTFDAVRGRLGDAGARRLYPDAPWENAPTSYDVRGPREEPEAPLEAMAVGSNNWAVSAARSASGSPLVANDPHVPLMPLPTFWHHVHLEAPRFRAQGGIFPGCPVFGFGHNGALAWGVTTGFRDGWDVFRIERTAADPWSYRTPAGSGRIDRHRATRHDRRGREIVHTWESCEHGVLYPGWRHHDGAELAVRHVSSDLARWYDGHLAQLEADDVGRYREALAEINEGPFDFNHVYGHRDGHIAWELVGRLPRRSADGLFVRDAYDPAAQWDGFVPFAEMPKSISPETGFVASANSIVDETQHAVVATRVHFEPRYRQERIEKRIAESSAHDLESFRTLQGDTTADYVLEQRDAILALLEGEVSPSGAVAVASEALRGWDGRFSLGSSGATIFFFLRVELARRLFGALLGEGLGGRYANGRRALPRLHRLLMDADDRLRADIEGAAGRSLQALAGEALRSVTDTLSRQGGRDPSRWGWERFHRVRLGTIASFLPGIGRRFLALNEGFACDEYTVCPSRPLPFRGRLYAFVGASSRFVCDLSRPDEAWFAHSAGPSGDIASRFFANLSQPWYRNELFRSALWSAEEIPDPVERLVIDGPS